MTLVNKVICITGATSGIGEACAKRFAKEGAKLIITGRRNERLEKLAQKLKPAKVQALNVDVRNFDAMQKAFESLPLEYSQIDVLVNNAGLALGLGAFETQPLEDLEQMVDTNIKGLMYATKLVLPGMIERDSGHIINIGSTAGQWPYPGGNAYGGTKAFVKQFSLNLRADLLGKHIRVTDLAPGMTETEFSLVRFHGDEKKSDEVYSNIKALQPEDIAETIHWIVSLPPHVNVNRIELMPVMQAFSPFAVHKNV